jgi:hypothetical protein
MVLTDTLDFLDEKREGMQPRVPAAPLAALWKRSEGESLWFEWTFDNQVLGGRLSPNEDDVDLEFWIENRRERPVALQTRFCANLAKTIFADRSLKRTWIHSGGRWKRMADTDRGSGKGKACHYRIKGTEAIGEKPASSVAADAPVVAVTSRGGRRVFALSWPNPRSLFSDAAAPCIHADPAWPSCPPRKRVHLRGKIYLMEGTLDDVLHRVQREVLPLER